MVPLSVVRQALDKITKELPDMAEEDIMLNFEFLVGSFFPHALENMRNAITQSYIEGYNEGKKEKV